MTGIVHEIFGLFVDDGSFAFAILAWVVALWLLTHFWKHGVVGAVLLFAGLGVVLAESTFRFSRKRAG